MQIEIVQELCQQEKIRWHQHAVERMQERDISRMDVIKCILHGEIIEDYPNDYPFPSCLIFGYTIKNEVIHTVVDMEIGKIGIITAYYPNRDKFEADLKTRKGK